MSNVKFFSISRKPVRTRNVLVKSLLIPKPRRPFSTAAVQRHSVENRHLGLQATDILDVYHGLVAQGRLKFDEEQIRVVMELRRLQKRLTNYVPPGFISSGAYNEYAPNKSNNPWWSHAAEVRPTASERNAIIRVKSHADDIANLDTPKGLFLTGDPGSGKSMLVDLWFSIIPTPYKARKHYSTLVLEIYRGVWEETKRRQTLSSSCPKATPQSPWNQAVRNRWRSLFASGSSPALRNPNLLPGSLPMPSISYSIARRLLLSHWLLVFDEIQLLDVSSAGLLSDVLSWFWRMGGVIVGTSNKVPDDLYRNGVQKERLEPFVEALKLRCPVLHLNVTADYRRLKAKHGQGNTWFTHGQQVEFENAICRLGRGASMVSKTIAIFGRCLSINHISDKVCQFTFEELCNQSLGPADYISIASRYSTIVLTGVPALRPDAKDQGRRFISLIDALYESRCRLVCMSESNLDGLFFPDTSTRASFDESNDAMMMAESMSETREAFRPNVSSYNALPPSKFSHPEPLRLETLSIFSGEEERFAYRRAHSRLLEMTSATYNEEDEWKPLSLESRRWETSNGSKKETTEKRPRDGASLDDDFAAEASYSQSDRERERPPAPRISEEHVWGVREDWGSRAKAWGKGAAVYDGDGTLDGKFHKKS